jgi:hypothetical protein
MAKKGHLGSGPVIVGIAILVAVGLGLVWRYTPLAHIVTPESAIAFAQSLSGYWWAPLVLILSYTPATLVMFPRWLITLAAVAIFGPWPAFAYAEAGVLVAALASYVAQPKEKGRLPSIAGRFSSGKRVTAGRVDDFLWRDPHK